MNINMKTLEANAFDIKSLASSYADIARECYGLDGAQFANELQNKHPLVPWLLNTPLSKAMRARVTSGLEHTRQDEDGVWQLEVPKSLWSVTPENSSSECCWNPVEFDRCAGEVPVYLLCLKDCEDILDSMMNKTARLNGRDAVAPIAKAGESVETVNERIAKLSMAMYTAHTLIQGQPTVTTNMTKPFNGLMEVMSNPAVMHIDGSSILGAFAELGCRLAVLGTTGKKFASHPLIINAIKKVITPDEYGRRPDGWSVDGEGNPVFMGIGFIAENLVPYSTTASTGEVWLLDSDAVGAMLLTDLIPTNDFVKDGWAFDDTNCGTECKYYYNAGACFGNNANHLAVISGISIGTTCANAIYDLADIVVPTTLIPR